jgi:hypothetical protein
MTVFFSFTVPLDAHIIEVITEIRTQNPQLQIARSTHLVAYQTMVVEVLHALLIDMRFTPEEVPTMKTERFD